MQNTYLVHILSHTHWDREWYLNSPYTNEWLIPFFNGLFTMLEKEPDYKFILDGQVSMIEDYFEELSKNEMSVSSVKRELKSHVERGALFIGPYYLQPDWQLLSEESLVRNFLYGQKVAEAFGGSMKSGWLLDNFGQISQTVQIHKLAGLKGLYVWRGVAMNPDHVKSEFIWEAPDGTKMLSVYLLNSYRNIMRLAEYDSIMNERMNAEVEKLKPFAATKNLLMMNGYDQEMIPDDIQPYIKNGKLNGDNYDSIQNDPDSYLNAIVSENPELPTLKGALYNGRFISVFPGVMSSRMYLKLQNDRLQKMLEKKLEPISLIIYLFGGEYGQAAIEQAWKLLLKNHPHDSICGVSIDDVHKDMEQRSRQIFQIGNALLETQAAYLAGAVDTTGCSGDEALIVVNTMLKERNAVISYKGKSLYVKNLPSFGYKVISKRELPESYLQVEGFKVSNSHIHFELNKNGSFNVEYKKTGKKYNNLGLLEDMGDSGDAYNYSFPDNDIRITSSDAEAVIEVVISELWEVCFRVSLVLRLPVSDVHNHKQRSPELMEFPVVTYISIEAESPVVKCRTTVRNTVRDHRLRVLFPTRLNTEKVYAASPFDITERPVYIDDYKEESIPDYVRKVIVGARETEPSTFFHTREFLDLLHENEGFAVFNKGLPEYQIIENEGVGTVALTLFRSVGWIAKDINTRIGDAGPEIFTPDAQCLREMSFEYAVCPHNGDSYSDVFTLSEEYNNEPIVLSSTPSSGELPALGSRLSLNGDTHSVKITVVKASEDGKGIVVRGVNLAEQTEKLVLSSSWHICEAGFVNLLEEKISDLLIDENEVSFKVKSKEIFSIKLAVEKELLSELTPNDVVFETVDFSEDFSSYPYAEYVTDADIESEIQRAAALEGKIDEPMWRRTALEAQLSVILTKHRKDEREIRKLGYELNEARIQRRIHDYISENIK